MRSFFCPGCRGSHGCCFDCEHCDCFSVCVVCVVLMQACVGRLAAVDRPVRIEANSTREGVQRFCFLFSCSLSLLSRPRLRRVVFFAQFSLAAILILSNRFLSVTQLVACTPRLQEQRDTLIFATIIAKRVQFERTLGSSLFAAKVPRVLLLDLYTFCW